MSDPIVSILSATPSGPEGSVGYATPFTFTVSRTGPTDDMLFVNYVLEGGPGAAADGADMAGSGPSGVVSIPAGQASATLTLHVRADAAFEPDEHVTVRLSPASPYGSAYAISGTAGAASATIENDDPAGGLPVVAIDGWTSRASGGEYESGRALTLTLVRSGDLSGPLTAEVEFGAPPAGRHAVPGLDFTGDTGPTVTFAPGQARATLSLTILDDAQAEGVEEASFRIRDGSGYVTDPATAGTVLLVSDNEPPPATPVVTLEATDATGTEAPGDTDFVFTLRRTGGTDEALTVGYMLTSTLPGGATVGTDVTGSFLGTVTFAPGQDNAVLRLDALDDRVVDPGETFTLQLRPDIGYVLGAQASATGTIVDDEVVPVAAAVLDFEAFPNTTHEFASYAEDGFLAVSGPNQSLVGVAGTDPAGNTGSLSLRSDYYRDTVTIQAASGQAFSVTALDVDTYGGTTHQAGTFTLHGRRPDGTIVSQSFAADDRVGGQTVALGPAFSAVTSIFWENGAGPIFTVDNIAVGPPVPSPLRLGLADDTGVSAADRVTRDGRLAIAGQEPGAELVYSVDGQPAAGYDPAALADGAHEVSVLQIDRSGHSSAPTTLRFVLDRTAPDLQVTAPAGVVQAGSPAGAAVTFSASAVDAVDGSLAAVFTETVGGQTRSVASGDTFAPGPHSLTATVTDAAGNTATRTFGFTVAAANHAPRFEGHVSGPAVDLVPASTGGWSDLGRFGDGRILVAWGQEGAGGGSVLARILDGQGGVAVPDFAIATQGGSGLAAPFATAITELANGNVAVAYRTGAGLSLHILDSSGAALGAPVTLGGHVNYERVHALADGGFVVTYLTADYVDPAPISAVAFDAAGRQTGRFDAQSRSINEYNVQTAVALEEGGWVYLWEPPGGGLVGQRFDAASRPVGVTFPVSGSSAPIRWFSDLSATRLDDGRIVVAWSDAAGGSRDVYTRLLDAEGVPAGPAATLTTAATDDNAPLVTATQDGGYAVAWFEGSYGVSWDAGAGTSLHARLFDAAGQARGGEQVLGEAPVGMGLVAAALPGGGVAYSWQGLDADGRGVRLGWLAPDGSLGGRDVLVNAGAEAGAQYGQGLLADGDGQVLATWADAAGGAVHLRRFGLAGASADLSVPENGLAVGTVRAVDPDAGDTVTYAIAGGADAALFTVGAWTGALAFAAAPDFENPADQGRDNLYEVVVSAGDGHGGEARYALRVHVGDVAETPPLPPLAAPAVALADDTGLSDTDGLTRDARLAVAGQEAGARLRFTVDGQAVDAYDPAALADGAHVVEVRQEDPLGRISAPATLAFTLDRTAPLVALDRVPARIEADSADGAAVTLLAAGTDAVDGSLPVRFGEIVSGEVRSVVSGATFGLGRHTVTATSTDAAGNVGGEAFSFEVRDTRGPALAVAAPAARIEATSAAGAVVRFSALAADAVDGPRQVTFSESGNAVTSGAVFGLGEHVVTAASRDGSGNLTEETFRFGVVDTTGPVIALAVPDRPIQATSPAGAAVTFRASAVDAVDGPRSVTFAGEGGLAVSGAVFAPGTHTLTATSTDATGHATSRTFSFTVTAPATVAGRAIDGYLAGATVFADANRNGRLDAGEASAVTDGQGGYSLAAGDAPLVVSGGVDTATGLAFGGVLAAPAGSSVITPLTTLVDRVAQASGGDVASAEARVRAALGLTIALDLTHLDPIASTEGGQAGAAQALQAAAQLVNTATLVAAAGTGGDMFAALARQIVSDPAPVDLTSTDALAALAAAAGADPDLSASVAAVAAASNSLLAEAVGTAADAGAVVAAVAAISTLAQGEVAGALAGAAGDPARLEAVLRDNTGEALAERLGEAAAPLALAGGDGPDVIAAGPGPDVVDAGPGDDRVNAGAGHDTVHGGTGQDTLFGEGGRDTLFGDAGRDFIGAGAGDDFASGGAEDDEVHGEEGDDALFGDEGNDGVYGEEGDDRVAGGSGHDVVQGGAGGDLVLGERGDDLVEGGDGADFVSGGEGRDRVFGGAGDDAAFGDTGDDLVNGGAGDDLLFGGEGRDVLFGEDGADRLFGEEGDDVLGGGAGDDVLSGGAGADSLHGEAGRDVLFGNAGDDDLNGGAGADTFAFGRGDGRDRVADFQAEGPDHDVLAFNGGVFGSVADVLAASRQVGADVVITLDAATSVTLANVRIASLAPDAFLLG